MRIGKLWFSVFRRDAVYVVWDVFSHFDRTTDLLSESNNGWKVGHCDHSVTWESMKALFIVLSLAVLFGLLDRSRLDHPNRWLETTGVAVCRVLAFEIFPVRFSCS